MNQLERELLRILVEAEQSDDPRRAFDRLVGEDRVVLDLLWGLTRSEGPHMKGTEAWD